MYIEEHKKQAARIVKQLYCQVKENTVWKLYLESNFWHYLFNFDLFPQLFFTVCETERNCKYFRHKSERTSETFI